MSESASMSPPKPPREFFKDFATTRIKREWADKLALSDIAIETYAEEIMEDSSSLTIEALQVKVDEKMKKSEDFLVTDASCENYLTKHWLEWTGRDPMRDESQVDIQSLVDKGLGEFAYRVEFEVWAENLKDEYRKKYEEQDAKSQASS